MKKCTYCGKETPDFEVQCPICHTSQFKEVLAISNKVATNSNNKGSSDGPSVGGSDLISGFALCAIIGSVAGLILGSCMAPQDQVQSWRAFRAAGAVIGLLAGLAFRGLIYAFDQKVTKEGIPSRPKAAEPEDQPFLAATNNPECVNQPAIQSKTQDIQKAGPKADMTGAAETPQTKKVEPQSGGDSTLRGEWFYNLGKERFGPVSAQVVIQRIESKELNGDSKLWTEGLAKWILVKYSPFKAHLPGTSTPPPLDQIDDARSRSPEAKERIDATFLDNIQRFVCAISGLPPIEGFRWRDLFSHTLKFKGRKDMDAYFNCGCERTTPPLAEVQAVWPQPWAFSQVLLLSLLVLGGLDIGFECFGNSNVLPGLIIVGAFAVPISCLVFFFELNVLRNISVFQVIKLLFIGGTLSIILTLILYKSNLTDLLGITAVGIIEELGKLLTAILLIRNVRDFNWILNGLLAGAAIGAGFAGFESAGYIYNLSENLHGMHEIMIQRAVLAPFGHVVWAASTVGALWRAKGKADFSWGLLFRKDFLRIFGFIVALHILWDSPLLFGGMMLADVNVHVMEFVSGVEFIGSWYLALTLVQAGLLQIQQAQQKVTALQPDMQLPITLTNVLPTRQ